MANPGIKNLTPWRPGQTGNPGGGSKKQSMRKLLREFVQQGLQAKIPPEVAAKLGEHLEGLKVGEAIAGDILLRALAGDYKSIEQIIGMEPKSLAIKAEINEAEPRSPIHLPTEEDEQALLQEARASDSVH